MAAGSQSRVFKALESTESILASLLLDSSSFSPVNELESTDGGRDNGGGLSPTIDVEQSLLGVGELTGPPEAFAVTKGKENGGMEAVTIDPRDTLRSIVTRSVRLSTSTESLEEQLHQKERELEVTARLGLGLLERKEFLEKEVTRLTEQMRGLEQTLSQARHELGIKESLLQLYYTQEAQNELQENNPRHVSTPEWVKTLNEECAQLKRENQRLWNEKQELEQEAHKKVQMSQTLVKQCVEQLSEAKQELMDVQTQMEHQNEEEETMKCRAQRVTEENIVLQTTKKQLEDEIEDFKDRLTESMLLSSQLTSEVAEWSDKYETCYIMLQSAKEEVKILKDLQENNRSGVHTPSSEAEHGSIVSEIEAVLRQEILAASTLDERPLSPSTYAKQRTMVVMETVKAATLATAKKLEKLAEDQRTKNSELLHPVPIDPNDPNERIKYVSPQKLQIVKPMEGSATLLQWKLLATPQLGGTSSFFSKSDRPGIVQRNLESPPPPSTPTPSSVGRFNNVLGNNLQRNKQWSSTSDLARHRVVGSSTGEISRKRPVMSHEVKNKELSAVNKVRQNIWGLFGGSPGKNNKKDSSKTNGSNAGHQQGSGLEELLT